MKCLCFNAEVLQVVDGYSLNVFSLVCKYRLGIILELLKIYQYLDYNFEFRLS